MSRLYDQASLPVTSDGKSWRITGYQAGRQVLEHSTCTARPHRLDQLLEQIGPPGLDTPAQLRAAVYGQLLFAAEPTHQRLRAALDPPLAQQSARLYPFVRQTVAELIAAARQQGEIDLGKEFAEPLSIRTLARLLGWPDEQVNVAHMFAWSTALIDLTTGHAQGDALPLVQQMATSVRTLVADKQKNPAEDLASFIATSPAFASETERVTTLMVIFSAGTSTTITALVHGLRLLLDDPERLRALRTELVTDRKALHHLVNELLRLVTPTQYVRRWATHEMLVEGWPIPAGACPIQVDLAVMNRDATVFPHPAEVDWQRQNVLDQAAFGFGRYTCPGAPLARWELQLAFEALLTGGELQLLDEPPAWKRNPNQLRAQGVRVRIA